MKPTSRRYLKWIHASSIVAVHHFVRAIQLSHRRATLCIATWTRSSTLLINSTTIISRCEILYGFCPPSFKVFSLRCVEAHLKVSNLIETNYGTVSSHLHKRVQKVREPISSLPHKFAKNRLWIGLNPLGHFCTTRLERKKKSVSCSKARVPTVLRNPDSLQVIKSP